MALCSSHAASLLMFLIISCLLLLFSVTSSNAASLRSSPFLADFEDDAEDGDDNNRYKYLSDQSHGQQQPQQVQLDTSNSYIQSKFFMGVRETYSARQKGGGVQLTVGKHLVTLDNGIVRLSISNPGGTLVQIQAYGLNNFLSQARDIRGRGYWDVNFRTRDGSMTFSERLEGTNFKVITQTAEIMEVSFSRPWNSGQSEFSMNVDIRYIMLQGKSGFYAYAIFDRPLRFPALTLVQNRVVFRLDENRFRYMAISDTKRGFMPTYEDRILNSRTLLFPEAVIIGNPRDPYFVGQVDDKYQYSLNNNDSNVYGWITRDPLVGFWVIYPSKEFQNGGPTKQDLTLHTGPTCLGMFHSTHYIGNAAGVNLNKNAAWTKVFGPLFIYINNVPNADSPVPVWEDAKKQSVSESQNWPYSFPAAKQFVKKDYRCTVSGRLIVKDRYVSPSDIPATGAYIGLASPGKPGSWQRDGKGYQFWSKADEQGNFQIVNVVPGTYNIYGWVPGFIGDYMHTATINLSLGSTVNLQNLIYKAPRMGRTLWEIGMPDRSAAEFFIPDARPGLVNNMFLTQDKYRQYGLWDRYTDLYPKHDLVYNIGASDYRKDWFFEHVPRRMSNGAYQPTSWTIKFPIHEVNATNSYVLQIALASQTYSHLQVRINDDIHPTYETKLEGRDSSIPRHGIHGVYQLLTIKVQSNKLQGGQNNSIHLSTILSLGPFHGHMYDYIRLEEF